MAFGYVIGNGDGLTFNATGNEKTPVYIDSNGTPQPVTGIDVPVTGTSEKADKLKLSSSSSGVDCYIPFVNPNSRDGSYYSVLYDADANPLKYNPDTRTLTVDYLDGIVAVADTLSSRSIGTTTKPVYIDANGRPQICNDTLANNISGNAATASKWQSAITIKISDSAGTTGTSVDGASGVTLVIPSTMSGFTKITATDFAGKLTGNVKGNLDGNASSASKLTTNAGTSGYPVYFSNGIPVQCNTTLSNSISGNAATASYCSGNCAGNASSADKLNTNGGNSTQPVYFNNGKPVACTAYSNASVNYANSAGTASSCSGNASTATTATNAINIKGTETTGTMYVSGFCSPSSGTNMSPYYNASVYTTGTVLRNAAWNDYAEYRLCNESAGICVIEVGDGTLKRSSKRLQKGASIVSDTFGMAIGPDKDSQAIALSGRVLAIPDNSKFKVGDAVCTGKNGTVSRMNKLEIILFPDRIIGFVSEFPNYKKWNNVEVNNRIWIRVK